MEAIRTTINSVHLASIIDLPESLRGREVEVIVLPTADAKPEQSRKGKLESLCGCLKEYADPALREQEEGA